MSGNTPLYALWQAVEEGFNRPAFLWQVLVLAVAVIGGGLVARWVNARIEARMSQVQARTGHALDVLEFSIDGVRRLALPVTGMGVIVIGMGLLRAVGQHDERLLRLALLLFVALAVIRFCVYVVRRALSRSAWLQASERTVVVTLWVGVVLYATGLLGDVVQWLDRTAVPVGRQHISLWVIAQAAASVVVTVVAALWVGSAIEARLLRSTTLERNLRYVLARVAKAALLVVAVLAALSMVGIDLTVLSVFGGALGVGLGLGLQRIASNYVAGFILLLDRSLRIGDTIAVDKHTGVVTQINTRYTVLRATDGTEAIVPNEMLVSTAVSNRSYSDRRVALSLKLSVSYDASLDEALAVLVQAAQSSDRVLKDPAPAAFVTGFGADGMELQVKYWIQDPEEGSLSITSEVAKAIHQNLRAAGIVIPYPQRELRWVGPNPDLQTRP